MIKTAEVVIIGGGIIGCSLAAELSKNVKNVVVVEKRGVSEFASSSNFGMVWLQPRFAGYDELAARRSMAIYDEKISEEFAVDIEYEKKGGLTVTFSEAQIEVMKKQCEEKRLQGINLSLLDKEETRLLEPMISENVAGAIYCENDAQLNPMLTTMAFADLARRRGVQILNGVEVIDIRVEGGKITSVLTSAGEISTRCVVNAAGSWSHGIANMVNINLPVFPQKLQGIVTEAVSPAVGRAVQVTRDLEEGMNPEKATGFLFVYDGEPTEENLPKEPVEDTIFTFVQQTKAGTIVIGTTNEFVGFDVRTTPRALTAMLSKAADAFPFISELAMIRSWASLVPFTFDGSPVVGEVSELPGFYVSTGHGHAMSHAPAAAEHLANKILNRVEIPEAESVGFGRFRK